MSKNKKISFEVASVYGEEAVNSLTEGKNWEWSPDSAEYGVFSPYYCNDKDCSVKWHEKWYVPGIRIENKRLYVTIKSCDADGNWDFVDEMDVDSPRYKEWQKEYDWNEDTMREYYQWAKKTGEDPLKQFSVERTFKKDHKVTVHLVDGCFIVKNPEKLSSKVKDFLLLNGNRLGEIEWKTIDEFVRNAYVKEIVRQTKNSVTFIVERDEDLSEQEIKNKIKAAAKKSLVKFALC